MMNKQAKTNKGMLFVLFIIVVIAFYFLASYFLAHPNPTDKCIIGTGALCLTSTLLILWVVAFIIEIYLIYNISKTWFWIVIVVNAILWFITFSGILGGNWAL